MVVAKASLGLTAVNHPIMKQIKVARTLPDLGMHDDRTIESCHLIRRRGSCKGHQLVVTGNHILPPALFEIPL